MYTIQRRKNKAARAVFRGPVHSLGLRTLCPLVVAVLLCLLAVAPAAHAAVYADDHLFASRYVKPSAIGGGVVPAVPADRLQSPYGSTSTDKSSNADLASGGGGAADDSSSETFATAAPRVVANFTTTLLRHRLRQQPGGSGKSADDAAMALLDTLLNPPLAKVSLTSANTQAQGHSPYHSTAAASTRKATAPDAKGGRNTTTATTGGSTGAHGAHRPHHSRPRPRLYFIHTMAPATEEAVVGMRLPASAALLNPLRESVKVTLAPSATAAEGSRGVDGKGVFESALLPARGVKPLGATGDDDGNGGRWWPAAKRESDTVMETVIQTHGRRVRVPIAITHAGVTLIAYDAHAGNVMNTIVQLRDHRFDPGVPRGNCFDMYLTVQIRTAKRDDDDDDDDDKKDVAREANGIRRLSEGKKEQQVHIDNVNYVQDGGATPGGGGSNDGDGDDDDGGRGDLEPVSTGTSSAFWNSFAQMFDTSVFCEVRPSLSLRVSQVPHTQPYYIVLRARRRTYAYMPDDRNEDDDEELSQCLLDVYMDQIPVDKLRTQQLILSFVLPLLILLVPLPFQVWRADIIQTTMMDIDIGEWMWYPPFLMRRKIKQGCVRLYTAVRGCLTARRVRARQVQLEARQQELAEAFEASQPPHMRDNNAAAGDGSAGPATHHGGWGAPVAGWGRPPPAQQHQQHHQTATPPPPAYMEGEGAGSRPPSPPLSSAAAPRGSAVNRPLYAQEREEEGEAASHAELGGLEPSSIVVATGGGSAAGWHHSRPALPPPRAVDSEADLSDQSTTVALDVTTPRASRPAEEQEGRHHHHGETAAATESESTGDSSTDCGDMLVVRQNPQAGGRSATSGRDLLFTSDAVSKTAHDRTGSGGSGVGASVSASPPITREEQEAATMLGNGSNASASSTSQSPRLDKKADGKTEGAAGKAGAEEEEEDEDEERICRICRDDESEEALVAPCACTGSVRWVHRSCLDRWRLESTKRNLNNVNRCEICQHDFTVGIRRSTMIWQSSRQVVDGVLLFLTCFVTIFLISTLSHSTFGELSCVASYHRVAYTNMYNFEGITISLFLYILCLILVLFAYLVVFSWFRSRPDVVEYINEVHLIPPFLTRRNVSLTITMCCVLVAQGLSVGYLLKLFFYVTSDNVWNWEISPLIGGLFLLCFMTCMMGLAMWLRFDVIQPLRERQQQRAAGNNAEDVVIANINDGAAPAAAAVPGNDNAEQPLHSSHRNNDANAETLQQQQQQQHEGAGGAGTGSPIEHHLSRPAGALSSPASRDLAVPGASPPSPAPQAAAAAAAAEGRAAPGQQGDEDYTQQFAVPPELRVIRAFEYCPPRRSNKF